MEQRADTTCVNNNVVFGATRGGKVVVVSGELHTSGMGGWRTNKPQFGLSSKFYSHRCV